MTTTYELYTNENGTPKAVESKAPAIIERVEALETDVTGLDAALAGKANDADLQVDLTAIRESITNVSAKVDDIGDPLSLAKKQTILDACDEALNGANPVRAGDPTLDEIKSALATIQAQLGQLKSRRYVKETGKSSDGNSWYRVWSDGWIEQGGTLQPSSSNFESFSFPVEMKNANFSIFGSHVGTTGSTDAVIFTDLTTASASCKSGVSGYAIKWYVCGY